MLRATGFFRGIDCPFYGETRNGRTGGGAAGDGCHRPYCHFRHSKHARPANSDRNAKESCSKKQNELAYDPCNPEVVRPGETRNGGPSSDPSNPAPLDEGALELERVNRAIEAVRSEVERERKKLSRIGDQEYDPTAVAKRPKLSVAAPPHGYNPGAVARKPKLSLTMPPQEYDPSAVSKKPKSSVAISPQEYAPSAVGKKPKLSITMPPQEYDPSAVSKKPKSSVAVSPQEYAPSAVGKKPKLSVTMPPQEYDPSAVAKKPKSSVAVSPQEYDPTARAVAKRTKQSVATATPLEYDPGSYQMSQPADYNPTPRSTKYTLESDGRAPPASSLEYVPTAVTRTTVKKPAAPARTLRSPSPPCSPPPVRGATPYLSSSSRHKYTLDNSKPSTDLEYDPLSNYSSRPESKGAKASAEQRGVGGTTGGRKRLSSSGSGGKQSAEEEYVPTFKKPKRQAAAPPAVVPQKYTASFSESDDESSGTEYRPTSLDRLQRKKGIAGLGDGSLRKAGERGAAHVTKERRVSEVEEEEEGRALYATEGSDGSGPDSLDDRTAAKKTTAKGDPKRATGEGKEPSRKGGEQKEKGGDGKKVDSSKKTSKEEPKKHGKTDGRKAEVKIGAKEKSVDKNSHKEVKKARSDSKKDSKGRPTERDKGDSGSAHRDRGGGGGSSLKKVKSSDKHGGKESAKPRPLVNGKPESGAAGEKVKKRQEGSDGDKDRRKGGTGGLRTAEGKAKKAEKKQKSLTHADLFGDESAEEREENEEEEDDDDDDDRQGSVVRKSASALRRGGFGKTKRKELTPSSSDDDDGGNGLGDFDDYGDDADADYTHLQVDLDYEEDPMEECLRIFNESKDVKTEDKGRQAKQGPKESEEDAGGEGVLSTLVPGQKKRVSHFMAKGSAEAAPPKPRPYRRLTAQEICYQRMQIAQQQATQLAAAVRAKAAAAPALAPPTPAPRFPGERKRVAHRPNQSAPALKSGGDATPLSGQMTSPGRAAPPQLSVKAHTSAGILSKTTSTVVQKRVAHTPTMKSSAMKRPIIPSEFGAKVPTTVRQRYLNIFIDECLKFCPSEEAAFETALQEEKVVYERSSSRNIYLNVAVNTLKKLRSKSGSNAPPAAKSPLMSTGRMAQSHEATLGGRLAAKTSFTINRAGKQKEEELTGANLYRKLREYLMTEEQLQEHSYPRPHPDHPGRAVVHNVPEKKNTHPFSKVCCRCGAEYKIAPNGNCVRKEECSHHWGRLRRHKVSGGWETQYSCCAGSVGSPGCQVCKQHVQDGRKEALDSYVTTFEKPIPADGDAGVYALDCEMCYTKLGLELTRVTVINSDLKVIYDTFVKPESKVVDYNTRFSGVTEEDLEGTTIRLRDVQAVLLSMFSADSILIGHSLESDLFALKLIHSTVVDTAIVFPHRLGLPYKRALRNLMADYLKRIIQDNVEGHDSSEDASACMQLMMWKIREDTKVKR